MRTLKLTVLCEKCRKPSTCESDVCKTLPRQVSIGILVLKLNTILATICIIAVSYNGLDIDQTILSRSSPDCASMKTITTRMQNDDCATQPTISADAICTLDDAVHDQPSPRIAEFISESQGFARALFKFLLHGPAGYLLFGMLFSACWILGLWIYYRLLPYDADIHRYGYCCRCPQRFGRYTLFNRHGLLVAIMQLLIGGAVVVGIAALIKRGKLPSVLTEDYFKRKPDALQSEIILLCSCAMSCLGVLFFIAKRLRKKRKGNDPFSIAKFWSGLIFRIGEALTFSFVLFVIFWSAGGERYHLLPVLALFIGMFVEAGERVMMGIADGLFAASKRLFPLPEGVEISDGIGKDQTKPSTSDKKRSSESSAEREMAETSRRIITPE